MFLSLKCRNQKEMYFTFLLQICLFYSSIVLEMMYYYGLISLKSLRVGFSPSNHDVFHAGEGALKGNNFILFAPWPSESTVIKTCSCNNNKYQNNKQLKQELHFIIAFKTTKIWSKNLALMNRMLKFSSEYFWASNRKYGFWNQSFFILNQKKKI